MDTLSTELIENILSHCHRCDYLALATVCHRLYSIVNQRCLYGRIGILYPRKYYCLLQTLSLRPELFLNVQTLDFSRYTTCGGRLTAIERKQAILNPEGLEQLLWNCKNLHEIFINNEACDVFASPNVFRCLLDNHPDLRTLSVSAISFKSLINTLTDILPSYNNFSDGSPTSWRGPTHLNKLTFISHVDLNDVPVFPAFFELLIENNKKLTQLDFSNIRISTRLLTSLDPLRLTHLSLEHCQVPDNDLLAFLERCTQLKVLNIKTSPIYSKFCSHHLKRFARIPFTQLQEVNLIGRGQHLDDEILALFSPLVLKNIKTLAVDVPKQVTMEGLQNILKQLQQLTAINLSFWQDGRCWMWYTYLMHLLEQQCALETVRLTSRLTHLFPRTVGPWLIQGITQDTYAWRRYDL
ncbi:hypothetical protein DFQ29_001872 [Apophysomyces sp. BC1021]|nr:hypothetical protein DFQ29_001872 [Apophysomyces sp. BC1021]